MSNTVEPSAITLDEMHHAPQPVIIDHRTGQRTPHDKAADPNFIAALGSPDGVENIEYEFPQIQEKGPFLRPLISLLRDQSGT